MSRTRFAIRGSTMNVTKIQIGYDVKTWRRRKCFDRNGRELIRCTETVIPSFWSCLIAEHLNRTCVPTLAFDVVGPRCATRVSALSLESAWRWRPCGVVQGGGCRGEMIVYPSRPYSPFLSPTTHATPVENATLNSHGSAASHCARLCAPIDPATTHFTSGWEWNKVPPGGMVRPRSDVKETRGEEKEEVRSTKGWKTETKRESTIRKVATIKQASNLFLFYAFNYPFFILWLFWFVIFFLFPWEVEQIESSDNRI